MSDIWTLLQARKRGDPGAPLVTFVDGDRRERVELSVTSLENAAAKIANALRSEYDLEPGSTVAAHVPVHWQRAAWCAGIWTAGCVLVLDEDPAADPAAPIDLTVSGPEEAVSLAAEDRSPLAVVSLHPFGLPIGEALPVGADDATLTVRLQPDAYLFEPPDGLLPALRTPTLGGLSAAEVLDLAHQRAAAWGLAEGGVLMAGAGLDETDAWLAAIAVPVALRASVVLTTGSIDEAAVVAAEHVSAIAGP